MALRSKGFENTGKGVEHNDGIRSARDRHNDCISPGQKPVPAYSFFDSPDNIHIRNDYKGWMRPRQDNCFCRKQKGPGLSCPGLCFSFSRFLLRPQERSLPGEYVLYDLIPGGLVEVRVLDRDFIALAARQRKLL